MRRAVKSHAILVELVKDVNSDPLQQLPAQIKNYISLDVKDFSGYSL